MKILDSKSDRAEYASLSHDASGLKRNSGMLSVAVFPTILAHGAGVSGFDELAIFGGIGLIILGLIYMSWRAGRKRKRALDGEPRRRRR